jgi:tetratricopeptide (TPR) repeat protein
MTFLDSGFKLKKMFAFTFDENLQDIPKDPEQCRKIVDSLKDQLKLVQEPTEKVKVLCDLGSGLRLLRDLENAKNYLKEAIDLCETYALDLRTTLRAQIILAHILQWQGNFKKSNRLFGELIMTVESNPGLKDLKAFVYQHAGKNLFDQKLYSNALKFFQKALSLRERDQAPQDLIDSSTLAIRITEKRLSDSE